MCVCVCVCVCVRARARVVVVVVVELPVGLMANTEPECCVEIRAPLILSGRGSDELHRWADLLSPFGQSARGLHFLRPGLLLLSGPKHD